MGYESDFFAKNQSISLLSLICPVYNESKTVEKSLRDLFEVLDKSIVPFEIVVVESNSIDGSRLILNRLQNEFGFNLILQDRPRGKGNAVREGMNHISGDVFMIFDLDGEYDPRDIIKLLVPIENGLTSFVLGSRHTGSSKLRTFEKSPYLAFVMNVAHLFFTFIINTLFNVKLKDPFTMYKIMRKEIFEGVTLVSDRFDLDWEFVCLAIRLGSKPLELPVNYSSRSFSEGKKIRLFLDPLTWILAVLRFKYMPIGRQL